MKVVFGIPLILLLISGCNVKNYECLKDSDCATAGCSGQICTSNEKTKGLITTCEFKEEYKCLKFSSCGCVNNKCQWKESNEYSNCLEGVGA